MTYHREVRAAAIRCASPRACSAYDAKRLHYFHEMSTARPRGILASTNELLSLHVSRACRGGRRRDGAEVLERLGRIQARS